MMEHMAWHAVHAASHAEERETAFHILHPKAQRSPWHAPYATRPPLPPASGDAAAPGKEEAAADAPPREEPPLTKPDTGDGGAALEGSILKGLTAAPLWAPLGVGSPDPLATAPCRDLVAPADPAAPPPVRDS